MKRNLTATVVLVGGLVLTAACTSDGGSSAARTKAPTFPAGGDVSYAKYGDYPDTTTKDVAGPCSWEATSAKDYSGVTLKVISHAVPVLGEPTVLHAKQFSELTGAEVDVVNVPFGELYQKLLTPLQAGQPAYDVMFYPSLWIGDMAAYLERVPQKYLDTAGMKDVTKAFMDVAIWDGDVVQYPVDGDRHYLKVRTDLLTDPQNMADYKAETGDELGIPTTWAEYEQVAEFLTGREGPQGEVYGSAEVTKRDDLMFSAFISRAAAYAKHPDVKGGFFFDVETMEPLINTPGWVKALDDFTAIAPSLPPGGTNFGLGDEILAFGGGQAAMSYSWDDAFIQAQQPDSPIRNQVAAAQLPGADQVWNRETGSWDEKANQAAYFTWGWTSAVAKSSKNKEAAFDYLCFFSNEANTSLDLQIGRFGINPYRNAHFDSDFWVGQGWSPEVATSYVETLADMEENPNRVFDLRVPGVNQYMSSLATGVAAAMAGQRSSQEALDGVAQEWEVITEQVGKDEVQAAYRNVVELEDGDG